MTTLARTGESSERSIYVADSALSLERGGSIPVWQLGYEVHGPARAPIVVVLGGISADAHVARGGYARGGSERAGWWDALVGEGRTLDTRRLRVLGIDYIGGSGESTSASSLFERDLDCARRYASITSLDQARAFQRLIRELSGGAQVVFIGCSFGGLVALQYAAQFPDEVRALSIFGAAHRPEPIATAWRSLQRRALRTAIEAGTPEAGVRFARALAITTYRPAAEMQRRFAAEPLREADGTFTFAVERFLTEKGEEFAGRFAAESYLLLSQAIDLHEVAPSRIGAPLQILRSADDLHVSEALCRELATQASGDTEYRTILARSGHDAFLKEPELLAPHLKRFLRRLES